MRILIAEDDLSSRVYMQKFLTRYGDCDVAVDGIETIDAFLNSLTEGKRYDLICLDIMMPKLDGLKALERIREIEKTEGATAEQPVTVIMTSALSDNQTINYAKSLGCEAFLWKPIEVERLRELINQKFARCNDTLGNVYL